MIRPSTGLPALACSRQYAAAQRLPFLPMRAGLGSDVLANNPWIKTVTSPYPDTDLFLLSLGSGKIYDLHQVPAQQGFPSVSGRQLVWQDATYGGDDVFTAAIPGGL